MATREELQAEYKKRLSLIREPIKGRETAWVWLWYCTECYALDRSQLIFQLCQKDPKDNGLANIWRMAKGEITDRELFDLFRTETADLYVGNLFGARVLASDSRLARWYSNLTEETALEGVKACRPVRGLPTGPTVDAAAPTATCEAVAEAAATIWLRFVDQFHDLEVLPRVRDLREVMLPISAREAALLEANDFATYALTVRERADLKRDLGISLSVGGVR